LILDTDGGVDDAQALLLLIANGRPPDAITTVFGNVSLEAATKNILAVLAVAGADIEVHAGAAEPLAQARIDARHVHGQDGLGGAPRPKRVAEVAGTDAVAFLIATLSTAAKEGELIDLLMIGPLTNLALALKQAPRIASGIGRLTIMGGTLHGRGNVTPAAEFNIFSDPEAAGDIFRIALDITVVPWEPCLAHAFQGAVIDRMFAAVPESDYKAFARAGPA
jgi:purine nucleosidase/non-specific riboncleoside hydrolase